MGHARVMYYRLILDKKFWSSGQHQYDHQYDRIDDHSS
jgi:hypothetical protein